MRAAPSRLWPLVVLVPVVYGLLAVAPDTRWLPFGGHAEAQTAKERQKKKQRQTPQKRTPAAPEAAAPAPVPPKTEPAAAPPSPPPPPPLPRERVEADVSTRSIAVTSGFTGTEIIIFGSVDNSRQTSAEAGYYDVVVVVEGLPLPLIVRRKSNVAGLWVNTEQASFERVPSYYAIASTRPIEEIADAQVLETNAIGLDYAAVAPTAATAVETTPVELKDYRAAIVRLKQKDGLFIREDYNVAFIGRSLFRSSIELPPNVPVGPLTTRVYLFHDGALLNTFSTRVRLEREGIELLLYRFAMRHSLLYGLMAVAVAVGAGLLASAVFTMRPR